MLTDEDRARIIVALEWYQAEAAAIARYMQQHPPKPEACIASITVLSLDAGERARAAIRALKDQ